MTTASMTPISSVGVSRGARRTLAGELELGLVDNAVERNRFAFDEQDIVHPDRGILLRGKVASAPAHDHEYLDLIVRHGLELGRLCCRWRASSSGHAPQWCSPPT